MILLAVRTGSEGEKNDHQHHQPPPPNIKKVYSMIKEIKLENATNMVGTRFSGTISFRIDMQPDFFVD